MTGPPAVAARRVSKSFGGVRALDEAELVVHPGEVHGLLGENGSGKSTLIKVLAGYHAPDPDGELEVGGHSVGLPLRGGEARRLGLTFVHQDLGLIPSLTVLENLRLPELATRQRWYVSWARERRQAVETFGRYGVALDPRTFVTDLRPVERALLAIVRAMEDLRSSVVEEAPSAVLFLDEPTIFLPKRESEQLFTLVRVIAQAGTAVVFVSHDLGEVHEITDRVTVLRDGRTVGTVATRATSTEDVIAMILGRVPPVEAPIRRSTRDGAGLVSVAGLTGGTASGIWFEVGRGEILGLTGLAGSGFADVPYLLFGAHGATAGRLTVAGDGHDLTTMTPARARSLGVALVPADRRRDGAVGSLPLLDNLGLPTIDRYRTGARLDRGRMRADARDLLRRFDVRPADPTLPYDALSGGNQQKALLAKWLQTRPSLLLLDEPTQGVDVGARPEIRRLIRAASADGAAVLCASADFGELASLCDRVLVLANGRVAGQLEGSDVSEDRIAEWAYGRPPAGERTS
jgi:ribose transport system ATP-binding protein